MSETSQTESKKNITKTVKINDSVFLDVSTNMVILVIDRVTMTMTLQEYITMSSNVIQSVNYIQHFISVKSSLVELSNRGFEASTVQSGSTLI